MDKDCNFFYESRIKELEKKLDLIICKLEKVESGTTKMSDHINFINDVYVKVQRPLFWICDKVNYMRSYKIENTNDKLLRTSVVEEQD